MRSYRELEIAQRLGLSGRLLIRIGSAADYNRLARFHYVAHRPATFALVGAIDYQSHPGCRRTVAVGVLSHPSLNCGARDRALQLEATPPAVRWDYLNRHVRTISRVIVHPQFRGIGLATEVSRFLIGQSPVRYVEAISRLAEHHGLFLAAGMKRMEERYFLYDAVGGAQDGVRRAG